MYVIIIQPQIFKDKYLQCDSCIEMIPLGRCLHACGQFVCLLRFSEFYSEVIVSSLTRMTGRDGTKLGKKAYVKDKRNYM